MLIFPGQKAESRVHVTESGTLSIQSARVEDSGEYSCNALNAAGSSLTKAHITVTGMSAICAARVSSDIPVTETQTETEMIDINKTHTETNTEKIFNSDTRRPIYNTYRNDHVKN